MLCSFLSSCKVEAADKTSPAQLCSWLQEAPSLLSCPCTPCSPLMLLLHCLRGQPAVSPACTATEVLVIAAQRQRQLKPEPCSQRCCSLATGQRLFRCWSQQGTLWSVPVDKSRGRDASEDAHLSEASSPGGAALSCPALGNVPAGCWPPAGPGCLPA